jgi:hypothetical protein
MERTTGFEPATLTLAKKWGTLLVPKSSRAELPISAQLGTVQHYSLHVVLPISSQRLRPSGLCLGALAVPRSGQVPGPGPRRL